MTVTEAAERVRALSNGAMPEQELRTMAKALYGKSTDRELDRLLADIRYWRIARATGTSIQPEAPFVDRVRRDYTGPLHLDNVPLGEGLSVVTVESPKGRWFIAPQGAIPTIIHWLEGQMAPKESAPTPAA